MNFLAPWAFIFSAIAPIIVLLYLLKLRRKSATVSTLLFWQRVLDEKRRTALFQRLRNPLSLLLHLLIFALLLLALAKPVFDQAIRAGDATVLVIDTRARMQAGNDRARRFDNARRAAMEMVSQAGPSREIAILTAGADATVAAPFSSDTRLLKSALHALTPTDAGGDLEQAMTLANDLLASRSGNRRIILLTAPSNDSPASPAPGTELEVRIFGEPAENTAITAFAARQLPADPQSAEVLLEISHFGQQPTAGNVELRRDGELVDVRPYRVTAEEPVVILFPAMTDASSGPGWLTARLDRADALMADNLAFASLPRQKPRSVLLVTAGNWFLEKLLAADRRVRFELLTPDSFREGIQQQFDVVIFDRFLPSGMNLAGLSSNTLFIGESPITHGSKIEQPVVTEVDETHPALRSVNLRNVSIGGSKPIALQETDGWRFKTLLGTFDHALAAAGERRSQRLAVIGFDLIESDLPLRVAFPLLIGNLVQWLAGEPPERLTSARAGEVRDLEIGVSLDGPHTNVPVAGTPPAMSGDSTWQPLRNGFYRTIHNGVEHWVAVNTFDSAESDLAVAPSEARVPTENATSPPWGLNFATLPPWQYLALAALGLLLVEWRLFHRRHTE